MKVKKVKQYPQSNFWYVDAVRYSIDVPGQIVERTRFAVVVPGWFSREDVGNAAIVPARKVLGDTKQTAIQDVYQLKVPPLKGFVESPCNTWVVEPK